jgi:pantetheine-phosphate adenylyltransferase
LFDTLIVAVLHNPNKTYQLLADERAELLRKVLPAHVEVDTYDGLLADYVREKNIHVILRGLRTATDFEQEAPYATLNRHLTEGIETLYLPAEPAFVHVSASLVREALQHLPNENIRVTLDTLIPPAVLQAYET